MGLSLHAAISRFRVHLQASARAESTIEAYLHSLKLLAGLLGNIDICRVTPHRLDQAVVILAANPYGVPRSAVTMNRIKSAFRSFFRWLFETGALPGNPAACLRLAPPSFPRPCPISLIEMQALLDTIRRSSDPLAMRDEALLATYAFTGLRRAEVLHLRITDYDAVTGTLWPLRGKGGGTQPLPVPSSLAVILDRYLAGWQREQAASLARPLFPGRDPHLPLSNRQATARFEAWKKRAGIRMELSLHSFRAGFAAAVYDSHRDVFLVAKVLGHRDIRSTLSYVTPAALARSEVEQSFIRSSD